MYCIAQNGPGLASTYCMYYITKRFWVRTQKTDAETKAYMEKLAAIEPFQWEIQEPDPDVAYYGGEDKWVQIDLAHYCRNYRIIMGQLLKGCSEHKDWLYDCFMAEDQEVFFSKTLEYFREALESDDFNHGEFIADHCWFGVRYSYDKDAWIFRGEYQPQVESIREVLDLVKRRPDAAHIWDTYLYQTEGEFECEM